MLRRLVFIAALGWACRAATGPLETLRARDTQIRESLGGPDKKFEGLLNDLFDYETHTRESFGRHWEELNERERGEAVRLVRLLLERSSMDKAREYRSDRVQYLSERVDPANPAAATVVTRIGRGVESWEVAYRMRRNGDRWQVVDVIVEGASTIESNRAAFYKEIRTSGVNGLLDKLRKKGDQRP